MKKFANPELEVVEFETEVIATSVVEEETPADMTDLG